MHFLTKKPHNMTTALTTQTPQAGARVSALEIMARNLNVDAAKLTSTLKATVFKGATDEEMLALVVISNAHNLNPLLKEIYAFPSKGGIVPIVSIDGWINKMNANAAFDGIEFKDTFGADGKIVSVTATIHRKDRSRPTVITEYFAECQRATDPWRTCPARMLRHKALIQGVRVAFGFSGVYDEDEARTIAQARDVTPVAAAPAPALFAAPTEAIEADEVQPPAAKKRGPKAKAAEEPAPAPAPAPEQAPEPAPAAAPESQMIASLDLLMGTMDSDEITTAEVWKFCHAHRLVRGSIPWEDIGSCSPELAAKLVAEWETAKTEILAARA